MNKIIRNIALIALGGITFQSCDSFLEVDPYDAIDQNKAVTNIENSTAALTGTYDGLQHYYSYGRDYTIFGDVLTNNVAMSAVNSNRFIAEAVWGWTTSTADFRTYWFKAYSNINRANNIINATIAGNATEVNQIVGEAYAIRALVHFDLVRLFAQDYNFTADHSHLGVPYVLKFNPSNKPARNTVKEVYDYILADLDQASKLITKSRSGAFTINASAVNAMYARVYLHMGNYAKAKEYAELVIAKYPLVSNADYLAGWSTESTSESIFSIANSQLDYQGVNSLAYIYSKISGVGYGDYYADESLLNLYATDDVRKGWYVKGNDANTLTYSYPANKYVGRGALGINSVPVFRSSEMYLIAAESAARIGGQDATAQKYLDAIAQRALPSAPASTESGQALIDKILLEKRKEFAFEGIYFHDLKRLHLPIRTATTGTGAQGKLIEYGDNLLAWPIPEDEINANPNIAKQQNPGY